MNGTTVFSPRSPTVSLLFLIAWWGDRGGQRFASGGPRAVVDALSPRSRLHVLDLLRVGRPRFRHGSISCPSTSARSVISASAAPLVARIARLARAQNVTTVADFVRRATARPQSVAAVAALILLFGSAPYVALQLKAVATTLRRVVDSFDQSRLAAQTPSTSSIWRSRLRSPPSPWCSRHAPDQPEGATGRPTPRRSQSNRSVKLAAFPPSARLLSGNEWRHRRSDPNRARPPGSPR